MARKPLTKHQQMLVAWGTRDWASRMQAEGDKHPVAGLARKMYGQEKIFNSNHQERGSVSPLGGVATETPKEGQR
jgi:hypothetical protein